MTLALTKEPDVRSRNAIAVAGGLVWFSEQHSDPNRRTIQQVRGYNPANGTWTHPLSVSNLLYSFNETPPLQVGSNGAVYFVAVNQTVNGGSEHTLWQFKDNRWNAISPPLLVANEGSVRFAFAGTDVWLVSGKAAYWIEPTMGSNSRWERSTLPIPPTRSSSSNSSRYRFALVNELPVFSPFSGLWQMTDSGTWTEQNFPLSQIVAPADRQISNAGIIQKAGSVWVALTLLGGDNSVLARFSVLDKKAAPRLYTSADGLPGDVFASRLSFDTQGGTWLSSYAAGESGWRAYYLAPNAKRFRFVADEVQTIRAGESDDRAVYLLRTVGDYQTPFLWRHRLDTGNIGPLPNPKQYTFVRPEGGLLAQGGRLLVGTTNGLFSVSRDGRTWTLVDAGGLFPSRIAQAADGTFWVTDQASVAHLPATLPSPVPPTTAQPRSLTTP